MFIVASVSGSDPVVVVRAVRSGVGHNSGSHRVQLGHVHTAHQHPVLHARSAQV